MIEGPKIAVTGMGIVSAIGLNIADNLQALMLGNSGIGQIKHLQTKHLHFPSGEINASNAELSSMAGVKPGGYDRTTLLGIIAAENALQNAGITNRKEVALVSSTTVGGMCNTELQYGPFLHGQDYVPFIQSHDCAASTFAIADTCQIHGPVDTLSTACSSSVNAIILGARMLKAGKCKQVLVGGTDSLSVFTLNGFNTLQILDTAWCRPFDQSRAGLNLGEGAAYLLLETENDAMERGADIKAFISGYANNNDAFHQTASSAEGVGASLAMQGALQMANLHSSNIDYINAHGTATPNNDQSECAAFANVFGKNWPKYSSTKCYTGHTLAAAGSIEAVYSILALQHNTVFPNLNHQNKMEHVDQEPVTQLIQHAALQHILSNSFGFGGNCTSIIFSKR